MDNQIPPAPPVPPSPPPVKRRDWFKILLIVIGFLVILGLFGNLYLLARNQKPVAETFPTPTPIVAIPTSDPTANWKTYTNTKLSFSFKYPNDWDPTIEESYNQKMSEIALVPYLNISINFVGGWMGKSIKQEKINVDNIEITVSLWLNCDSSIASEWEKCNSKLDLNNYDTAILRAEFTKGQDKWLITYRPWKKGERDENTEFSTFNQILSTFQFLP